MAEIKVNVKTVKDPNQMTAEEIKKHWDNKSIKNDKKKSKWFQKIPTNVLLSPGGFVLIIFAGTIELIDLIPLPIIDQLWELPLEVLFIVFFMIIVPNASFKSLVIPIIIERIPLLNDILPTFFIKMIM